MLFKKKETKNVKTGYTKKFQIGRVQFAIYDNNIDDFTSITRNNNVLFILLNPPLVARV